MTAPASDLHELALSGAKRFTELTAEGTPGARLRKLSVDHAASAAGIAEMELARAVAENPEVFEDFIERERLCAHCGQAMRAR